MIIKSSLFIFKKESWIRDLSLYLFPKFFKWRQYHFILEDYYIWIFYTFNYLEHTTNATPDLKIITYSPFPIKTKAFSDLRGFYTSIQQKAQFGRPSALPPFRANVPQLSNTGGYISAWPTPSSPDHKTNFHSIHLSV